MIIFVIRSFKFLLQARLSFSALSERKESPDSTEQCTGEQPGPDCRRGTDSATENNYPSNAGKGENVR